MPSSLSDNHTQLCSWACTSLQFPTSSYVSGFTVCCIISQTLWNAFILTQRAWNVHIYLVPGPSAPPVILLVLPFKGLFINRQLKSSLGGGRQGSMNQFCKQGNQGKERLSNTKWVTEQGSGRTRLNASLGAPNYHGLFYLPADWAQVFHPVLPTPPTGRMWPASSFLSGHRGIYLTGLITSPLLQAHKQHCH